MLVEEIIGAFTGENRRRRQRSTALGVGTGLLLGATLGVLFAPKSGKETRKDIADATLAGVDLAKQYSLQGLHKAQALAGQVQETLVDVSSQVLDKIKGAKEELCSCACEGVEALEEGVEEVAEEATEDSKRSKREEERAARKSAR